VPSGSRNLRLHDWGGQAGELAALTELGCLKLPQTASHAEGAGSGRIDNYDRGFDKG